MTVLFTLLPRKTVSASGHPLSQDVFCLVLMSETSSFIPPDTDLYIFRCVLTEYSLAPVSEWGSTRKLCWGLRARCPPNGQTGYGLQTDKRWRLLKAVCFGSCWVTRVQTSQRIEKLGHMWWEVEQRQLLLFISVFIEFFFCRNSFSRAAGMRKFGRRESFLFLFSKLLLDISLAGCWAKGTCQFHLRFW